MKKFILLSVLFFSFVAVKAQEPMFVKGDKVVNLGVGFGWYTNVSVSGEYCVKDGVIDKGSIGLGAYGGVGFSVFNAWYSNSTSIFAGARGTFHYPFIEKLDTYGGVGLGLNYRYWKYSTDDLYLDFNPFLGARYPLTDKIKVFGEVGYGYMGNFILGISFKF